MEERINETMELDNELQEAEIVNFPEQGDEYEDQEDNSELLKRYVIGALMGSAALYAGSKIVKKVKERKEKKEKKKKVDGLIARFKDKLAKKEEQPEDEEFEEEFIEAVEAEIVDQPEKEA